MEIRKEHAEKQGIEPQMRGFIVDLMIEKGVLCGVVNSQRQTRHGERYKQIRYRPEDIFRPLATLHEERQ